MLQNFDESTRSGKCAVIPAKERFSVEYSEEKKLNEEFHRFVDNFKLAYQGPNNAHAQIGSKYPNRKSGS